MRRQSRPDADCVASTENRTCPLAIKSLQRQFINLFWESNIANFSHKTCRIFKIEPDKRIDLFTLASTFLLFLLVWPWGSACFLLTLLALGIFLLTLCLGVLLSDKPLQDVVVGDINL